MRPISSALAKALAFACQNRAKAGAFAYDGLKCSIGFQPVLIANPLHADLQAQAQPLFPLIYGNPGSSGLIATAEAR